ncbi:carbonic anhydrase family protein [Flaviaesturariibacter amylovorans]|uniref:Carbonic anhydrase family protein n=1 Tax=Flaviaesturariibacter amylovorans TaxID=1084520 RepID=A0ABP8HD54_9BACT
MYTHSKETQSQLTPELAFDILKEGNQRFVKNLKANRDLLKQVNETKEGQFPFATILSCMDSRTSAELVFDQGLGDIFSIRIAGNVLNEDILGSMEFATKVVGTKILLVLGHTRCGAIVGACNGVQLGHLTGVLARVHPAIEAEAKEGHTGDGKDREFVNRITERNVRLTMERIYNESPVIRELVDAGAVKIAGGVYAVETGEVTFFED